MNLLNKSKVILLNEGIRAITNSQYVHKKSMKRDKASNALIQIKTNVEDPCDESNIAKRGPLSIDLILIETIEELTPNPLMIPVQR